MFRAPCMSQRRLALIFCVSVLIVLLIALILLCECGGGPARGARGSWRGSQGSWGSAESGDTHTGKRQRETPGSESGMCSSRSLSVPDIWWRDRSWGRRKGALLLGWCRFEGLGLQWAFLLVGSRAASSTQSCPPQDKPWSVGRTGTDTGESLQSSCHPPTPGLEALTG